MIGSSILGALVFFNVVFNVFYYVQCFDQKFKRLIDLGSQQVYVISFLGIDVANKDPYYGNFGCIVF